MECNTDYVYGLPNSFIETIWELCNRETNVLLVCKRWASVVVYYSQVFKRECLEKQINNMIQWTNRMSALFFKNVIHKYNVTPCYFLTLNIPLRQTVEMVFDDLFYVYDEKCMDLVLCTNFIPLERLHSSFKLGICRGYWRFCGRIVKHVYSCGDVVNNIVDVFMVILISGDEETLSLVLSKHYTELNYGYVKSIVQNVAIYRRNDMDRLQCVMSWLLKYRFCTPSELLHICRSCLLRENIILSIFKNPLFYYNNIRLVKQWFKIAVMEQWDLLTCHLMDTYFVLPEIVTQVSKVLDYVVQALCVSDTSRILSITRFIFIEKVLSTWTTELIVDLKVKIVDCFHTIVSNDDVALLKFLDNQEELRNIVANNRDELVYLATMFEPPKEKCLNYLLIGEKIDVFIEDMEYYISDDGT